MVTIIEGADGSTVMRLDLLNAGESIGGSEPHATVEVTVRFPGEVPEGEFAVNGLETEMQQNPRHP